MKYESIKVITGTPRQVEKKLNDYFAAAHPSAVVISTALAAHQQPRPAEKPDGKPATPAKPAAGDSTPPAAELVTVELETVLTMTATVGIATP